MARKKKEELVINMGPVNVAPNPKDEVVQKIANLCTSIGDRSFVIRQAEHDIMNYYGEIDQLREQLRALETAASENPKA